MDSITSTDVQDLMLEILKRLPVKSLCRFRCVCKSWNSLFSSTFFITFHHNFMVQDMPTNQESYFMVDQLERRDIPGYALYHPHQRHTGSECITNIGLPFPVENIREFRGFKVIDVIHGVACLASGLRDHTFLVWNPTTHKYISLPNITYGYEGGNLFYGFGFSAAQSDFKVVVFLSATPYYDIFSVQDGFWRRNSVPNNIYEDYTPISRGVFLNGIIYWISRSMTDGGIISMLLFECERGEFKSMELPLELCKIQRLFVMRLFKFSGKLSLLRQGESLELPLELWVMEEGYGVTSTWKKLFTIDNVFWSSSLLNHDILVSQDGNIFVACRDELSSVDLPFDSGTMHQPLNSHVFRESLFLMDVMSKSSSQKGWKCKDRKFYFGYRFRVSELLNLCLDVATKLIQYGFKYYIYAVNCPINSTLLFHV